jgi:hypothetical protein
MATSSVNPSDQGLGGPSESDDPFIAGDEMLERAKRVARNIEDKVRQLTDDTKTNKSQPEASTDPDATEEMPPVP